MRLVAPWMLASAALACGGAEPTEPAQPKIPVVTGQQVDHAQSKAGAFEAAAFTCCGNEPAAAILGAYVGVGEALAADDGEKAKAQADALRAALAKASTDTTLTDEVRPLVEEMARLTDRMAGQDLTGAREEFLDLTTPALALAAAAKGDGPLQLSVAFCPMKPGRWLQTATTIANPYYGAEMLTCGVFEPLGEAG